MFCPFCGSLNIAWDRNYCYDCGQQWKYEISYGTNTEGDEATL